MKALIVVDYQYDFIAEDGALPVAGAGDAIEQNIVDRTKQYNIADIYFTLDCHAQDNWSDASDHPEGKIFPPHCLQGTKGYEVFGALKDIDAPQANYLNKRAYAPNAQHLNMLVDKYTEIELCGVVTDICVFQTAIALYTTAVNSKKQLKLSIRRNCCASFNPEREEFALTYLKEVLGCEVE